MPILMCASLLFDVLCLKHLACPLNNLSLYWDATIRNVMNDLIEDTCVSCLFGFRKIYYGDHDASVT